MAVVEAQPPQAPPTHPSPAMLHVTRLFMQHAVDDVRSIQKKERRVKEQRAPADGGRTLASDPATTTALTPPQVPPQVPMQHHPSSAMEHLTRVLFPGKNDR